MLPTAALCVLIALCRCACVSSFLSASYVGNRASVGLYESSVTLSPPSILEQASMIAIETTKLSRGRVSKTSSPAGDGDGLESRAPARVKKVKPVKLSPAEMTGYNYSDGRELFDVPFINEPLWYRVLVRKGSESTVCESLLQSVKKGGQWASSVVDAFYPRLVSFSFQRSKKAGKGLAIVSKPMIPGVVFVKMLMNPDLADDMESSSGVNRLATNEFNLVVPLDEVEAEEIAIFQQQPAPTIDEEMSLLQIGEYVSVVDGQHKGKYGIIEGTRSGDIQVRLRSEYRDSVVNIDVHHLRYLQEPPEVNYKTMTAKQAVESLMVKEPDGDMLKFLRREGLLKEILHPEVKIRREQQQLARRQSDSSSRDSGDRWSDRQEASDDAVPDTDRPRWTKREFLSGRDGGRSQSSISVNRKQPYNNNNNNNNKINQLATEEPRNGGVDGDSQSKPWKRVAAQQSSSPTTARRWPNPEGDGNPSPPRSAVLTGGSTGPDPQKEGGLFDGEGEDFDSFIERMLSEADNEQKSKPTRSNPSSAPPDAADGRRRKGTDYSTAATGGSSSASLDNEDFESFLDRMLSENEGEQTAKKTGNKSPATDRRGRQGASNRDTSPVAVVGKNIDDSGFSFDWLDSSSSGGSIDQTLDELLNTPPMRGQLSSDDLFSENYSVASSSPRSREVNEPSTASRGAQARRSYAAASSQRPLRSNGGVDEKAVPRPEKRQYSAKEKGSRTLEVDDDALGGYLFSGGSGDDDGDDSIDGADRVIGTPSKRRLYNGQKEYKKEGDAAVGPNIDDYASFEDYFNALVASNVPGPSVYYDVSSSSASSSSSRGAGNNKRSTTVQRSDRERQQQQPAPTRSPDTIAVLQEPPGNGGSSGRAEVIMDMRTSSVEISLDNAVDKSVVQSRAGVDIESLSKLSVKELKAQCKEKQLSMTGLKADLIAKLLKSQQ